MYEYICILWFINVTYSCFFLLILDLDSFGPLANKRLRQRTWQTLWQAEHAAKTIAKDHYHQKQQQQQQQHRTKTLDLSNISNKKRCLSLSLSLYLISQCSASNSGKRRNSWSVNQNSNFQAYAKRFRNEKPTTRRRKTSQKSSSRQTGRQRDGDMLLLGAGAWVGAAIIDDTFDI